MNTDREFWLGYAILLCLLLALWAGISCAPVKPPICDALVQQIEKADTHERLSDAERLYRRHGC